MDATLITIEENDLNANWLVAMQRRRKALDGTPTDLDLARGDALVLPAEKRYNPDQPRAPKGDPEGGQWVSDAGADNGDPQTTIDALRNDAPKLRVTGAIGDPAKQPCLNASATSGYDAKVRMATALIERNPEVHKAVIEYQNSGYSLLNAYLRGTSFPSTSDGANNARRIASALDGIMTSTLNGNAVVYRAYGSDFEVPKGGAFVDHGFVSTSADEGFVKDYAAKHGGSVVKIVIPRNVKVGLIEKIGGKGEKEILLPRGATYTRRKLSDGTYGWVIS